ncbi:hypothetical protein PIGHUM_00184 [Pigmentiphaga humi]|uniref:PepSY-associated TM helix n=1 Tax=Pigmentiphaga humi TaxID=2478468 RepID=A0A3P4AVR4_9BURK|nr:PepSY-associated TM helix domain-containing protein [Pigmentiphaga humi]VCU68134.1 hypothetical protein PIGHUM_00184 [Pigmentiphaga humi]
MRPDGKQEGLRQSMAWAHTWSGLVLGWLLYAVFLTGTLSFFLDEINQWMRPELHRSVAGPGTAQTAVDAMQRLAPDASTWTVTLPGARQAEVQASWRPPGAAQGRAGIQRAYLDAATGDTIETRDTRAGNFLYRFHFELYGMPRIWGRWIVGAATMFMFAAIISGVITHRKIFADFFTFRRNKGQRSWLDAHNATAVFALPFHLVITFSGLLLLMGTLMPSPREALYGTENAGRFIAELRGMNASAAPAGGGAGGRAGRNGGAPQAVQADVAALLAQAHARWDGSPVGAIVMTRQGSQPILELREEHGQSLANRGQPRRLRFDGVSGGELESPATPAVSAVRATYNTMASLHLGRFADPIVRWALFLSGVLGTLMVATGMMLWVSKRLPERAKLGRTPAGHRLVEVLNVAAIAGMAVATAAYFFLNRLLPTGLAGRADWEINGFFIVWALTLAHAAVRPDRCAWREQLGAATALFAAIPLLNAWTGGQGLAASIPAGQWAVAGFDLAALLTGLLLAWAAVRIGKPRAGKPARQPARAQALAPAAGEAAS